MSLLNPRQAQVGLLHAVVWVLLGVLIFTQPVQPIPTTSFYLLQAALFVVSLGVFYLNIGWAVPRLLYRHRVLLYIGFVVVMVLGVALPHRRIQTLLQTPQSNFGPPRPGNQKLGPGPGSTGARRPGPPPGGAPGGLFEANPAVLLSTLLVLGLGTSIAAVQRGQREAQLRQALEQEKLSTELSWLKAQLNPHFFFNTLNNIYTLTLLDGDQAREAIHRLSRMMRYVLYDTQAGMAPLSQEIQFVRDYLDLMQLRLTENVTVEFETPAPLHETSIAPLLLLTFVENAFKHGVSALAPSHIRILVRQPTPTTLDILVENPVFPDRPVALDHNSGIGLANTRRRLALLYPQRHTLTVTELTPEHHYRVYLSLALSK